MASIKNLEMAAELLANEHIETKKTLLGLGSVAVYKPTGSKMKAYLTDYNLDAVDALKKVLNSTADDILTVVSNANVKPVSIGNVRLEGCLSGDGRFAALQLFRFSDFKYSPITPIRYFTGENLNGLSVLFQ